MFPCFQRPRRVSARKRYALYLVLFLVAGAALHAQGRIDFEQWPAQPLPDTAAPWVPAYGFNADEFSIGGTLSIAPASGNIGDLWGWLHRYGITILENRGGLPWSHIDDTLRRTATPRDGNGVWHDRLIVNPITIPNCGHARDVEFFPFDSSASFYWPCKFLQRRGGDSLAHNGTEFDRHGDSIQERVYDRTNTTAGDTILSRMVMGYDGARMVRPWPAIAYDDSVERRGEEFNFRNDLRLKDANDHPSRGISIVVKGHLFSLQDGGGGAADADPLFVVELWNEVQRGVRYMRGVGDTVTFTRDTAFLYASVNITKGDLNPVNPLAPIWNEYREAAVWVDMTRQTVNGPGGPWEALHGEGRFDVRVRWTGAEKAALRSVTLRDTTAQLLFGNDQAAADFRERIWYDTERLLRGPDPTDPAGVRIDSTRQPDFGTIIRFYCGDEPYYQRFAGFNAIDSLLYRHYPDPALRGADTVMRGIRAWHANAYFNPSEYAMTSSAEICVETYPSDGSPNPDGSVRLHGLPPHINQMPALPEHNGGRMTIPMLTVEPAIPTSRDSVEVYAQAVNRFGYGAYNTGRYTWPHEESPLNRLGHAASASRRTGRRLIQWVGIQHELYIQWVEDPVTHQFRRETTFSHMPDPPEIRMLTNLGLCYGARGFHYSWLGAHRNSYQYLVPNGPGTQGWNYELDWSPFGFTTADTLDSYAAIELRTPPDRAIQQFDTLRNFWTGWNSGPREIAWIDTARVPALWPRLGRLRWRDGYSMHFTVPQTYYDALSAARQTTSRPLPANEIIRSIEAYDRYGRKDSAMNTFVELGLFDTQPGRDSLGHPNKLYDTNHIFVVNRRTFERPADVPAGTPRGALMDSLADVRTLKIRLHVVHPNNDHYNYVSVREIGTDTLPMVASTGLRHRPVDTVLYGDSTVILTLRPGGGALLQITYCPPEESIGPAELRRSSQRKLLWDGNRYHAVYVKPVTSWHQKNLPQALWMPFTEDGVYYRRSLPMTDSLGAIQWEGVEHLVSDTMTYVNIYWNRFPSMTLRKRADGDTAVTVAWTNYGADSSAVATRVNLRMIRSNDRTVELGPIELVGYAHGGRMDSVYGTPVVSRLHGGDVIAWSDGWYGILTRFRPLMNVWNGVGAYSTADSIAPTTGPRRRYGMPGRFPSMPPFADIAGADSSIAIVWEQPGSNPASAIRYARLLDTVITRPPGVQPRRVHMLQVRNELRLNTISEVAWNPSIDQTQDVLHRLQDGVVWEESRQEVDMDGKAWWHTWIYFRSLNTPTTFHPGVGDSIGMAQLWGLAKYHASQRPVFELWGDQQTFPSVSALNQVNDPAHPYDTVLFTFAHRASSPYRLGTPYLDNAAIQFGALRFRPYLGIYAHNGYRPNMAASDVRFEDRGSMLYQMPPTPDTNRYSNMHTSRQFFAKGRPVGYMAEGREAGILMSDSAFAGFRVEMYDPWYADPSTTSGVAMAPPVTSPNGITTLAALRTFMRTASFTAHDSTTIAMHVRGAFIGDSTFAPGATVNVITELVNAANDNVLAVLDSFGVTSWSGIYDRWVTKDFDLLSGDYYVRLRIDTAMVRLSPIPLYGNYAITGMQGYVEAPIGAKSAYASTAGHRARIAVQPNPVTTMAQLLYSVPGESTASIVVRDAAGRTVATPLVPSLTSEGRYALDLDTRGMAPGTYLVELRAGTARAVTKMVVVR